MPTVSCSDGHEEIHFEGCFSALCPLCAQIAKTAEAEENASQAQRDAEEAVDEETVRLEGERDEAQEKPDKLQEEYDVLEAEVKDLRKFKEDKEK